MKNAILFKHLQPFIGTPSSPDFFRLRKNIVSPQLFFRTFVFDFYPFSTTFMSKRMFVCAFSDTDWKAKDGWVAPLLSFLGKEEEEEALGSTQENTHCGVTQEHTAQKKKKGKCKKNPERMEERGEEGSIDAIVSKWTFRPPILLSMHLPDNDLGYSSFSFSFWAFKFPSTYMHFPDMWAAWAKKTNI